jgi:predicted ATPase/DNA-binding XRE family transcriptional regulator
MATNEGASFGARLRRLREASGLSQEELAHRAGLTPNAVGTLERGERRRPYPNTVRALADALDLDDAERAKLISSVPTRSRITVAERALPAPPTPLIGRDRDVRSINDLLRHDRARVVTLTGPGGVGKTRLAIEVASRVMEEFPDGVIFVDLAPLGGANLVLPTIARTMGLRETGSLHEALRAVLAARHLMLVLDNFEHVLDAAVDVAWLLESSPNLTVLVTSRAPLRIRGENEYQVAPLEMPDPGSLPSAESVERAPAAQLFVSRAQEASPSFSLNRSNAGTIAAICWRLEGLPLALELAAAQTRFVGPTTVLSRLDQVLQSAGARDLPPRQRTMRATLDWDHDLLSEAEKAAFRRLGVFAGGFTLQAAETVLSGEPLSETEVFALMGQLVEKSLVMAVGRGTSDTTRYRMLEPVRQYTLNRLEESGEADAVRSRHARFFSALAEKGGHGLKRADQLMWLELLSEEHDNLRAALGYLLERGDTDEAAELGWDLWFFWSLRGHLTEGQRWMEALLARDGGSNRAQKKALWVIAIFCYMSADVERTISVLNEILATDDDLDEETLTHALMLQGTAVSQDDPDHAEALLTRALELARRIDDRWSIPHTLQGLARAAMARTDFDAAEQYIVESLNVARKTGERWTLAVGLSTHALIALLQGHDERAEGFLGECTALALALRDPYMTATATHGLAVIAGRRGDGERMAHLAGAADALREATAIDIAATVWRTLFDQEVDPIRGKIGSDKFDLAYSEGRSMTPEELIGDLMPAVG